MSLPSTLLYMNGTEEWSPLPEWAEFLISVGACTARNVNPDRRLVVALSLPTRAFAACFAAVGVIRGRCAAQSGDTNADPEAYFRYLSDLPHGTPLLLLDKGRWIHAVHDGIDVRSDRALLRVRVQDDKIEAYERALTHLLRPVDCVSRVRVVLEPNANVVVKLPGRRQIGHKFNERFLEAFLGSDKGDPLVSPRRVACAILGHKALIKQEACLFCFAVRRTDSRYRSGSDTGLVKGRLQDILQAREFLPDRHMPYFTRIYPVGGKGGAAPDLPEDRMPLVVIFDGARAFLKWHSRWLGSNWIVLLDRTDRRYDDAAEGLNQRFSNRTSHRVPLDADIPNGIDVMAFWEER